MKLPKKSAASAALLSACAFVSIEQAHAQIPAVPSGTLAANVNMVKKGASPTVNWNITYPSVVKNYVEIIGSTVKVTKAIDIEVRIIGNGVTASSSSSSAFTWVPAEATLQLDGGGYNRIFYGTNLQVQPSNVVWSKVNALPNQIIAFGGRYYYGSTIGTNYTSTNSTTNVRTLVNGDTPPLNIPANNAPSLEQFLRPYLNASGKVNIGPLDLIVFMELTHNSTQQSNPGYDLQDMVLLVTCKPRVIETINPTVTTISGVTTFNNLDISPAVNGVLEGAATGNP